MDQRTGFVPNRFWAVATVVATLSTIYDCLVSEPLRILAGIVFSVMVTFLVALVLFQIGLFGGSDAKALIVLSVLVPTVSPFLRPSIVPIITSLSTLVNLVMFLTLILAVNTIRNLSFLYREDESLIPRRVSRIRRLLLLCGYKRVHLADHRYHRRRRPEADFFRVSPHMIADKNAELTESHTLRITRSKNSRLNSRALELWVPLKIPLIPIITLSLVVTLLFGDSSIAFVA
jgi:preflagellin peptidase FlaK